MSDPRFWSHSLSRAPGPVNYLAGSTMATESSGYAATDSHPSARDTRSSEWRDDDDALNVLSIAGMGRSGSTLLGSLLGLVPGFVPVGEVSAVWEAVQLDALCGCGENVSQCPFWTAVGETAFGGWSQIDSEHLAHVNRSLIVTHRKLPFLFNPRLRQRERTLLETYTTALGSLYRAIKQVSGAAVIVDSTQSGPYVLAIRRMPNVRVRIVHLVRDSRGVAFSWQKLVARPEFAGVQGLEGTPLGGVAPSRSGPEWLIRNLLVHLIAASGTPRILVRYESLIEKPRAEIQRILEYGGNLTSSLEVQGVTDDDYEAKVLHQAGGNRSRFTRGRVQFRLDEAWRTKMTRRDRLLVSAVTFPLLVKYGYIRAFKRSSKDLSPSG